MHRVAWLLVLALLAAGVIAWAPPSRMRACPSEPDPDLDYRLAGLADARVCAVAEQVLAPNSIPSALLTQYQVLGAYPHDPNAFLQGLLWYDGGFYESTGLFGESSLRRVAFPSGEVLQQIPIANQYFAEGLALVDDHLVQLTWRNMRGFVYDRETFAPLGEFTYQTEGWGLTYDGTSLIMSDGSDTLTFLDPTSYQPVRTVSVTLAGQPVEELNELEWIKGEVWANVWQTDLIVRIDPATGVVTGVLNMTGLYPVEQRADRDNVLNGIAYDASTDRIFVGGKRWPQLFEIHVE